MKAFIVCLWIVGLCSSAFAQTEAYWLNPVSGKWSEASKWSTPVYPNRDYPNMGDAYDVTIDAAGADYTITMDIGATLHSLVVDAPSLTLNTFYLRVGSPVEIRTAQLTVEHGGMSVDGDSILHGNVTWNNNGIMDGTGTTYIADDALVKAYGMRVRDRDLVVDGELQVHSKALAMDRGSLTIQSGGVLKTYGIQSYGTPTINVQNGTTNFGLVNIEQAAIIGGDFENHGVIYCENHGATFWGSSFLNDGLMTGRLSVGIGYTFATNYSDTADAVIRGGNVRFRNRTLDYESNIYGVIENPDSLYMEQNVIFHRDHEFYCPVTGNIDGEANITIHGEFTPWTLSGSGATTLTDTAVTTFTWMKLGRDIDNRGLMQWNTSSYSDFDNITMTDCTLHNDASGIFEINAVGLGEIIDESGTGQLVNDGLITKSGTGGIYIRTPVTNNAQILVQQGKMFLAGGGHYTGSYQVDEGVQLGFGGQEKTTVIDDGLTISGPGTVVLSWGQIDVMGALGVEGLLDFDYGVINLNAAVSASTIGLGVTNLGSRIQGVVNVEHEQTWSQFTMLGGTLGGTQPLHITQEMLWQGGTILNTSGIIIEPGATLLTGQASSSENQRILTGLIVNHGVLDSYATPYMEHGHLVNAADGSIVLHGIVYSREADDLIENHGVITAYGGTISAIVDNYGDLNVVSSTLNLSRGTNYNQIQVADGATLAFAGSYTQAPGSVISGAGGVSFDGGTHEPNDAFTLTGAWQVQGNAGVHLHHTFTPSSIDIHSGTLYNDAPQNWNQLMVYDTLSNEEAIHICDSLLVHGGDLLGLGSFEIDTGAEATFEYSCWIGQQFTNHGQITMHGRASYPTPYLAIDQTTVHNASDGEILWSYSYEVMASGEARWINDGRMVMADTYYASWQSFDIDMENHGVIDVDSPYVDFERRYQQYAGLLHIGESSRVRAVTLEIDGGRLAGSGEVEGDVQFGGTGRLEPGESAGKFDLDGNLSIVSTNAVVAIEIGGRMAGSEYDQVAITGDVALGGKLELTLVDEYVPTAGEVFNVITYEGGRSGKFASVDTSAVGPLGDLTLAVLYDYLFNFDEAVVVRVSLVGDANVDDIVDIADLTRLSQNYGRSDYVTWADGDFNQDGIVDIADLTLLSQHYGQAIDMAQVLAQVTPAPGAAGMFMVIMAGANWRRRRVTR
ncbi:hypothetical protein HED60_17780 [Planctomycetales bacterium ZRK34]|nr:hypothetical protein HED60_17780 [Planctomycetales bacterium ZRK34]